VNAVGHTPSPEFSVAMTDDLHASLLRHLRQHGEDQEDLTFAVWRPSRGKRRLTAIVQRLVLPTETERVLHGNVAFTADYLLRALAALGPNEGLALAHNHFGPGWQDMSLDDVEAEENRLAGPAFGRTGLPVVGLTSGSDGSWSARAWNRVGPSRFERQSAKSVRVVGLGIGWTFHPALHPIPPQQASQIATISVWGDRAQADLARARLGVVGLGSVGSLVCESLARVGARDLTLIDHDRIELRNLDRTAGAVVADAAHRRKKTTVAARTARTAATAPDLTVSSQALRVDTPAGLAHALDCDLLFCCVDRPWPRHLLNSLAYAHLIPVVDGGILAAVAGDRLLHADWRIHTVGHGRACMVCLGSLEQEDIALDMAGKFDEPDYIRNLPPERAAVISRRNVFPFSMSVAAHEVIQGIGCITSTPRLGATAPQFYHCYPGIMETLDISDCRPDCPYLELTASGADLSGNLLLDARPGRGGSASAPRRASLAPQRMVASTPVSSWERGDRGWS